MAMLVDIHNHSLFGLDDGAKDLSTSLAMLAASYAEGVRVLCLTPHYRPNLFPRSTAARAEARFAELCAAAHRELPDLVLHLGCEYHASSPTVEPLLDGRARPLGAGKWVLVEFATDVLYTTVRNTVQAIQQAGYRPLIAHAERYDCLVTSLSRVRELVDMRARIQINARTLLGWLPSRGRKFAEKLLEKRLVFVIASDGHDLGRRSPALAKAYRRVAREYGQGYADELFYSNPLALLEG